MTKSNIFQFLRELPPPPTNGRFSSQTALVSYQRAWLAHQIKKRVRCAKCGSKQNLTLDHIVPQDVLNMMGFAPTEGHPENWQVLCRACNHLKGRRLDFSLHKTKLLIVKYLNRLPGTKFRPFKNDKIDTPSKTESENQGVSGDEKPEIRAIPVPSPSSLWRH